MMWTLLSTLGGYIVALVPRLIDRWQDQADKAHELEILHMQMRQQVALADKGYSPADKAEEVRTDSAQDNAQYMEQMGMIYAQQERLTEKAGQWVKDWTAFTRPGVTYLLVAELFIINLLSMVWIFIHAEKIATVQDFVNIMAIVFDEDEMAMLGTIIAMWFGSRGAKK
jgi:hypothetical protein